MSEKDKKHLPGVDTGTAADMDEVMRKFDREGPCEAQFHALV